MATIECGLPFAIDGTGGVAFVNSPSEFAHQHVLSVLGTDLGERVMRGDYGTDTLAHVFDNLSATEIAILRKDVATVLAAQVHDAVILGVDANVADRQVNLTVRYRLNNDTVSQVSLSAPIGASGGFSFFGGSV